MTTPKPRTAASGASRAADGRAGVSHNLVGQRLGRKGRDTRERILAAAAKLLAEPSGQAITLSAVAREASLGMTALYLYFRDLSELLGAVLEPVMASVDDAYLAQLRETWADETLGEHTLRFVEAYHAFWARHTTILHLRNLYSDNGDARMRAMRHTGITPVIRLIAQQMEADPKATDSPAFHMATVLLTGLERLATVSTDPGFPTMGEPGTPPRPKDVVDAQVRKMVRSQARLLEIAIADGRANSRAAKAV
jgi:AcrR family transcriptional regulator